MYSFKPNVCNKGTLCVTQRPRSVNKESVIFKSKRKFFSLCFDYEKKVKKLLLKAFTYTKRYLQLPNE